MKVLKRVLGIESNIAPADIGSEPSAFGAWLNNARSEAKLSVPELSQASGVSVVGIYNIEWGKSINPRPETKQKLADALGIEIPEEVEQEIEEQQEIEGLGTFVDFDPYDIKDRPSEAGVYVFYDISERPIYIGESQNIGRRIKEHEEKFWFKYPIVNNAAYVPIPDGNLRKQIEQILIRFLKSNAVINKKLVDR